MPKTNSLLSAAHGKGDAPDAPQWRCKDPAKATAPSNLLARGHSLAPLIRLLLFVFVGRLHSGQPKTSPIDPITHLLIKQFCLGENGQVEFG
jgi:hypothetical protein